MACCKPYVFRIVFESVQGFPSKNTAEQEKLSSSVGECQFLSRCSFSVLSVVPLFTEEELLLNGGGCELFLCSSVAWGGIHVLYQHLSVMLLTCCRQPSCQVQEQEFSSGV